MQRKQAVLFDMDGTLIDTFTEMKKEERQGKLALFTKYFNYRMSKLPSYSYTEMVKLIETDIIMRPFQSVIKRKLNDIMLRRYERAPLKDGALEFLTYLKQQGYLVCLCTNNARHIVEHVVEQKQLHGVFSTIITSQDVKEPKPNPEMYLYAQEQCAVAKESCIIFEDMLEGVEAANNAQIECIAVYDAFNVKDKQMIEDKSVWMINDYLDQRLYELF